jgi:hypothetical protein
MGMTAEQGVAERLMRPARTLVVEDLAAGWFTGRVRLLVEDFAAPVSPIQLAGRVRGALGAALRASASAEARAGRACPWLPPSALDVLFRTQGRITPALEVPKPYVIAVERDGPALVVELALIGFASDWLEEVAAALVHAWRELIPDAKGSRIVDRTLGVTDAAPIPAPTSVVVLAFESPLELRWRDGPPKSAQAAVTSLLTSLGNRVTSLARWQDAAIEADWRALKQQASGLEVACLATVEEAWSRRSSRQQRRIPMQGDRPVLRLKGDLAPFLPWLAIGETTHVGSHAALGMGRYRLLTEG